MLLSLFLFLAAHAGAATFDGLWTTTFGDVNLKESTAGVRGSYVMDGEMCLIDGTRDGDTLVFKYQEPSAAGEGRLRLSADGKSFDGESRPNGSSGWLPWKGTRPDAIPMETGFEGLWDTDFGRLRLGRSGDSVEGPYSYGEGRLTGKAKGRELTFRYVDVKKGQGKFTLADDGQSFDGTWKAEGEKAWKPWRGWRVRPMPYRRWLYVIEARWEHSLAEREYTYGEMLKTFFNRAPNVEVRQRFFNDRRSLTKWLREAAFLAEPVVVYISSHGEPEGVVSDDGPVGAAPIAQALQDARNVRLLHFGACDVMRGKVAEEIQTGLARRGLRFPISGFIESVDWAGSAVADETYLELVLGRDYDPVLAVEETRKLLPFTRPGTEGGPFGKIGLVLRRPEDPPSHGNLDDDAYDRMRKAAGLAPEKR
ncbi:MAG: hypothetical protein HY925_05700 [Elusimicrobia bacterium]|nr:hypothetical protein [Elusimicrobiota bacterium]